MLGMGRLTWGEIVTKVATSELIATSDDPLQFVFARLRIDHLRESARRSYSGKGEKEDISEEHSEASFGT